MTTPAPPAAEPALVIDGVVAGYGGGDVLRGVLLNCATPEALEQIFPRFASAAPFLCLMVLHLLWPDIGLLLLVEAGLSSRVF